ncbi:MAG TPA: hypothetical protein VFL04_08200 [Rectinemataceae bacterium]|nr:hypothetical protein [Rectinemataceae bacterium]
MNQVAGSSRSTAALRYRDEGLAASQRELDALAARGAAAAVLEKRILEAFASKDRAIHNHDWQALDPRTIEAEFLMPRKEAFHFALTNWTRHIFLPGLKPAVADKLLMFGLGRIFSTYNDVGVQRNTDADVNLVVGDAMTDADLAYLARRLGLFAQAMRERFGVTIEIDREFTLLRLKTVMANLADSDPARRRKCELFYKSVSNSIHVFQDNASIRGRIFSRVKALPDTELFEHFLGLGSARPSFMKIRKDAEPLPIVVDGSGEKVVAWNVIGSQAFAKYWRVALPRTVFVSPPDWVFSMKYFVNRVYDYVCAMRNCGYDLRRIGFDAGCDGSLDPDYLFVREAHKLMLYLQELNELSTCSFGVKGDYSYVSRRRMRRFMELGGEKFVADFESMVLGGGMIQGSNRTKYLELRQKVVAKARDRLIEGPIDGYGRLPAGLDYELVFKDDNEYRICLPYTWADLAFFAFSVIAARMSQIVENRLVPALRGLGRASPPLLATKEQEGKGGSRRDDHPG